MTNDLDTLAIALYVRTDDLLKQHPQWAPWRPQVGIVPRLTDAELVTLAVMQALLGFTSEARWLRYARAHLGHLFRYLPQQSGYNKRLRDAAGLITMMIRVLATDTTFWTDDVWVVDSTPSTSPPDDPSADTPVRCVREIQNSSGLNPTYKLTLHIRQLDHKITTIDGHLSNDKILCRDVLEDGEMP